MNPSIYYGVPEGLEPAWDVARLFPPQGGWSEEDYLRLPGNRLTEFDHGRIEVLDMPSELHQLMVAYLYRALLIFVDASALGRVLFAPFPVRLWEGKVREPDLLFMLRQHAHRRHSNYWLGADLVMEVMSPDDPRRDRETKRREYALAGIPEYWLVDPMLRNITVFVLDSDADSYRVCGVYEAGQWAESTLLPGFRVDAEELFAIE
jgi:Uma2 family endonuclease